MYLEKGTRITLKEFSYNNKAGGTDLSNSPFNESYPKPAQFIITRAWYDEDIPRSILENLTRLGVENIELDRIALKEEQVISMHLPPAPVKEGDSRSANWNGLGQVELDAIRPEILQRMCQEAIDKYFYPEVYEELIEIQIQEREIFQRELKKFVSNL